MGMGKICVWYDFLYHCERVDATHIKLHETLTSIVTSTYTFEIYNFIIKLSFEVWSVINLI